MRKIGIFLAVTIVSAMMVLLSNIYSARSYGPGLGTVILCLLFFVISGSTAIYAIMLILKKQDLKLSIASIFLCVIMCFYVLLVWNHIFSGASSGPYRPDTHDLLREKMTQEMEASNETLGLSQILIEMDKGTKEALYSALKNNLDHDAIFSVLSIKCINDPHYSQLGKPEDITFSPTTQIFVKPQSIGFFSIGLKSKSDAVKGYYQCTITTSESSNPSVAYAKKDFFVVVE